MAEGVADTVGDASTDWAGAGLDVGATSVSGEEVGLVAGDTSMGLEATGLDEEAAVCEDEEVDDELQPASTISKPINNH